jgi:hypothetical protein
VAALRPRPMQHAAVLGPVKTAPGVLLRRQVPLVPMTRRWRKERSEDRPFGSHPVLRCSEVRPVRIHQGDDLSSRVTTSLVGKSSCFLSISAEATPASSTRGRIG